MTSSSGHDTRGVQFVPPLYVVRVHLVSDIKIRVLDDANNRDGARIASGKRPGDRWIETLCRHFVWLTAAACLAGYVYAYTSGRAGTPIRSDAFSYYVYLPSWFLYHDPSMQALADDCCGGEFPDWSAITRWPHTFHWVDPHPIGEAILIAPFFLVAHALTRWSNLDPDGLTLYYQHAAGLAGLFYACAGLWFLRRLLLRYFRPGVVLSTLGIILTGTSLYHYATFDSAWSHAFSFALVSAFLERVDAWNPESAGSRHATVVIGIISGLIILVRHPNVVLPICFAAAVILQRRVRGPAVREAAIAAAVAAVVISPQLWIYHAATRHWFISAYGNLGFTFASPHLAGVLVSPRKGLFFWAPLLLVALVGFALMSPPLTRWRVPMLLFLAFDTYLIASWWDWQLGASYGHRGFVDTYPLFALGLASALARLPAHRIARAAIATACGLLCALSIFQMLQYWHGVLPMSDITWAQYRAIFLKPW